MQSLYSRPYPKPKGGLRASWLHAGLTQQVAELECQLAAAQRDVQRLASDNDALMEVSNALAAQQRRAYQKQDAEAREGDSHSVPLEVIS